MNSKHCLLLTALPPTPAALYAARICTIDRWCRWKHFISISAQEAGNNGQIDCHSDTWGALFQAAGRDLLCSTLNCRFQISRWRETSNQTWNRFLCSWSTSQEWLFSLSRSDCGLYNRDWIWFILDVIQIKMKLWGVLRLMHTHTLENIGYLNQKKSCRMSQLKSVTHKNLIKTQGANAKTFILKAKYNRLVLIHAVILYFWSPQDISRHTLRITAFWRFLFHILLL